MGRARGIGRVSDNRVGGHGLSVSAVGLMHRAILLARSGFVIALVSVALLLAAGVVVAADAAGEGEVLTFTGACDASAVVPLSPNRLLVGDDANNILRVYSLNGGNVEREIDVYKLTDIGSRSRRNFSAIEGAARVGDRVYWIGSHARMQPSGKNRPNRRLLFALQVSFKAGGEQVKPVGHLYRRLSADFGRDPALESLNLERAIMLPYAKMPHLAPDRSGLDVQGLAAAKDGRGVLIALRNPVRGKHALVIPLHNPDELVLKQGEPDFGEPIRLDLGGLGIGSIDYSEARGVYYITAGSRGQAKGYKLFRWTGDPKAKPELVRDLSDTGLDAQAITISKSGRRIFILSDDGAVGVSVEEETECGRLLNDAGECPCSALKDDSRKSFRGIWLNLE